MVRIVKVVSYTALLLSYSAFGATYQYTAKVRGSVKINGPVVAAGIKWQCGGNRCTTSGPWATPGVKACQALAEKVGEIVDYGYKGRTLSSSDLKTCNKNAAALNQPNLGKSVSGPASATASAKSSTPLAISKTDTSDLHSLKGMPNQSSTTASPNKLPPVQPPITHGGGQTSAILPLDRKLGEPGVERDQLQSIARDKRDSLTDLKGLKGGPSTDLKGGSQPLTGLKGEVQPLGAGKLSSVHPEPLQPLKGDSSALRDAPAAVDKRSSIHPVPVQPQPLPTFKGESVGSRDTPAKPGKPADVTGLKGDLPAGNRIIEKNQPPLQVSKNVELEKLQPLNTGNVGSPKTGLPNPVSPAPAVKGLMPPGGLLITPDKDTNKPGKPGFTAQVAKVDHDLLQIALEQRKNGPIIRNLSQNCGNAAGMRLTIQGDRFGASTLKRSVAIIADGGRMQRRIPFTGWSDNQITANPPRDIDQSVSIGIVNAQGYLISNTQTVENCSYDFRVSGKISIHSCKADSGFSVRAVPVLGKAQNQGTAQTARVRRHPSDDFALAYDFNHLYTGTWQLQPEFNGSGCRTGQWSPQTVRIDLNHTQGDQQQDFSFSVGTETKEVSATLFIAAINGVFGALNIRLNNFGPKHGDSWHKANDSSITLSGTELVRVDIPEVKGSVEIGTAAGTIAGAAFGPAEAALGALIGKRSKQRYLTWLYYVNDLNYVGRGGATRITSIENGKIKLAFEFERNGTEIKGTCQGFCPAGDDQTVPDATFEPVIEVLLTPAVVVTTSGHSISYSNVSVSATRSNVNIHGACEIADICDHLVQYRDQVRTLIEKRIQAALNDKRVRNQVALAVRPALDFIGVGNEIRGFELSSNGVRFEQVPRR